MTIEQGRLGDRRLQNVHAQLMREKDEPSEGFTPIPIFLLFVFSAAVFWAGLYLERYSGGFRWYAYDPEYEDVAAGSGAPVDYNSPEWLMARGEKLYNANCATCHQTTGMGSPGVYPPLVDSEWATGNRERIIAILLHGLMGPIEVNGNNYNGNMPAFGNHPSFRRDRDLAAVISYVRNAWGNSASLVTGDRVTFVREKLGDRGPWTGDEMLDAYPFGSVTEDLPDPAAPEAGAGEGESGGESEGEDAAENAGPAEAAPVEEAAAGSGDGGD